MEVKVLNISKDSLKLEIRGENHTVLNLLVHYLLKDDSVEMAKYNTPHPLVGEPILEIIGENPVKSVIKAGKKILEDCDHLITQLNEV
jgi:DNA-directed RNA polymerase subunit L